MNKQIKAAAISFLLFATGAVAQTTVTGAGTANTVPLFTDSSTLSNSAITQSTGNINIGNPSAHSQLTIYGPEAIGEDTNGTAAIDAYNGDAFFGDNSPTNGIAVNGSGFVGIGTVTPGSPLEVNGNISVTRGSSGALVFADGTSLSSAAGLQSVSSGSLSSLGTVTTGVWNATPLTSAYLPSDVDYTDQAQTISGQKLFTNGVNIATAGSGVPLTVQGAQLGTTSGNTAPILTLQNGNANLNYLNFLQIRNTNGSNWTTATTRIQETTDVTNQGYIDFNPANGNGQFGLAFGSGTSEFMRIVNGGNIGIGTVNPGSPLEVNGNIAITNGSKGALFFSDGSSLSSAAGLQSVSSGSLSSVGTVTTGVWNATPLTSAYLPSDIDYTDQAQTISGQKSFMSNVGIGTVSPVSILHVASPMIPLATNGNPFGSGNVVIQALGGRSTTAGSALTFATAANTDGTNVWEQSRIISTGDTSNSSDASGRLYLQTRFLKNGNTWDWNNNLVLTSAGSVGIGTTSPGAPLEVNGNIKLTQGSGASIVFPDGTSLSSASSLLSGSSPSLGIGVGTASPLAPLDVAGTQTGQNPSGGHYLINYGLGGSLEDPNTGDIILLVPASTGSPVSGSQFAGIIQSNRGAVGGWNLNSQWYVSVQSAYTNNTGSITPLSGQQEYSTIPILITGVYNGQTYIGFRTPPGNSSSQWSLSGNWSNSQNSQNPILVASSAVSSVVPLVSYESLGSQISMTGIGSTGNMNSVGSSVNVGIGTTSPGATLEVNGSVKLTQGSGASMTFPDGTVQATAWNGTLAGGDYAESIDVLGDRAAYEPGDVIVIDDSETGKFHKSDKAYSKLVAGVFSTKPGLVGRRTTADRPDKEAEVPMAMMGIVPTKVSTENGPIERGDLLVSSSRSGYAMKGTDRDRLVGAVIGKALAPLKSDSGVIEVLVSLQ